MTALASVREGTPEECDACTMQRVVFQQDPLAGAFIAGLARIQAAFEPMTLCGTHMQLYEMACELNVERAARRVADGIEASETGATRLCPICRREACPKHAVAGLELEGDRDEGKVRFRVIFAGDESLCGALPAVEAATLAKQLAEAAAYAREGTVLS